MNWLFARLKEPSTYAGIAAFAAQILPAIATHNPVAIITVVGGALAAVLPESTPA